MILVEVKVMELELEIGERKGAKSVRLGARS